MFGIFFVYFWYNFDEATSDLDEETERLVMQEIEKVYKGKTKIIISHRRAVIERADATIEFN